jgi:hypothetical protein
MTKMQMTTPDSADAPQHPGWATGLLVPATNTTVFYRIPGQ